MLLRYAVASLNTLLVMACVHARPPAPSVGDEPPADALPCKLLLAEPLEVQRCATWQASRGFVLTRHALAALHKLPQQPTALALDDQFFYADASGSIRPTLWFFDGADAFSEGLVRTRENGKLGYMDATLTVRIPCTWTSPFPSRRARPWCAAAAPQGRRLLRLEPTPASGATSTARGGS